jgi:Flp pilus assembly pilin Flp
LVIGCDPNGLPLGHPALNLQKTLQYFSAGAENTGMPSATELSQRHAEPTFFVESSSSDLSLVAATAPSFAKFSRCRALLRRTRRTVERGATAVEYALMVGLIAVGIVTAVSALRDKTTDSLNQTAASTAGLIIPGRVKAGTTFQVKYIRNDLGSSGWAGIGPKGFTTGFAGTSSAGALTNASGSVEWIVTLTAPTTPGFYEVQVRKSGAGSGAGEFLNLQGGDIRVVE